MRGWRELVAEGTLQAPVDATFPLENIQEALARAMEGGRQGKVLLTPGTAGHAEAMMAGESRARWRW